MSEPEKVKRPVIIFPQECPYSEEELLRMVDDPDIIEEDDAESEEEG